MRHIATADNPSSWIVCLFFDSPSILLTVVVAPDDETFSIDIIIGMKEDVTISLEEVVSSCLVVDTDAWDPTFIFVYELADIVEVFLKSEMIGVVSVFDKSESFVWDNCAENDIVDLDVDSELEQSKINTNKFIAFYP